jgi:hypothetical protein
VKGKPTGGDGRGVMAPGVGCVTIADVCLGGSWGGWCLDDSIFVILLVDAAHRSCCRTIGKRLGPSQAHHPGQQQETNQILIPHNDHHHGLYKSTTGTTLRTK